MFEHVVVVWYFAIWSFGGGSFATMGPFYSQSICDEVRDTMMRDVGTGNHFSKCWKGPAK